MALGQTASCNLWFGSSPLLQKSVTRRPVRNLESVIWNPHSVFWNRIKSGRGTRHLGVPFRYCGMPLFDAPIAGSSLLETGDNMASSEQKRFTRRRFVKHATCTAFCCACLPLDIPAAASATPEQNDEGRTKAGRTGSGKVHLAAACGTYCGACPAYLAKHGEDEKIKAKRQAIVASAPAQARKGIPNPHWMDGLQCDGCLSGGVLAAHCQNCAIRLCAANKQSDARCTDCGELPCHRINGLINMGNYLHRKEYLPNLKKMREMGARKWVKKEEERWRCPRCGVPMSWYDAECVGCGAPRPDVVYPLS